MDRMPHDGVVCGVDTHANTHTAAVLDGVGRILDVQQFNATAVGYCELTSWAQSFGTESPTCMWGPVVAGFGS